MWQVQPTVIFGRNQVMEAEVNLPYCKEHGIQLYRRKSGGGCVYADMGNIMLSYISTCTDVSSTFDVFLQRLADALAGLGLDAGRSGRNDVLVAGRKVSGNAFFRLPSSSIVHGTMLFDSDFSCLEKAITPSADKVLSKGVSSVRQRVTNVKEELLKAGNVRYCDIDAFKSYLRESLCSGDYHIFLDKSQISEIEKIEEGYLNPDFISGRKHLYTVLRSGRTRAGGMGVRLAMDGDLIESLSLEGDCLPLSEDIDGLLTSLLAGKRLDQVEEALASTRMEDLIMGLDTPSFIDILKGN